MLRCLVLACLLTISGCSAHSAERTLDRTFTVTPGGTLHVDAEGASVKVSGREGDEVVVHMLVRAPDNELAKLKLDAVQDADGVTVTMRNSARGWFSWASGTKHEIEVTVPQRYAIDVHSSGGSLQLRDTTGVASLQTSGGSISATNVNGNIELRTSGGSIEAQKIQGDVDAATSGGSVRLVQIDGRMRAKTSGGSVHCDLVGANRGISATTSGGSIELTLPRATTGNLEASTSGGRVSSDLPVTSTSQERSRLVGTINGGGETIYAHTSGGSITVGAQD